MSAWDGRLSESRVQLRWVGRYEEFLHQLCDLRTMRRKVDRTTATFLLAVLLPA